MRVIIVGLLASTALRFCDAPKNEEVSEEPQGAAEESAAKAPDEKTKAPKARVALSAVFGGSLASVGEHVVELKVHRAGYVEGGIRTADGKVVSGTDVKLSLRAHAAGGARPAIRLAWEPKTARFAGRAAGDATLAPGPIDISLDIAGAHAGGTLEHYALVTGPHHGGQIVVAGDYSAEVLASADGEIRAFITDASGVEVDAAAGLDVTAQLPSKHRLALEYDPATLSFVGRLKAEASLKPGRLSLVLRAKGTSHVGGLARLVVRAKAAHGGHLVTVGDYSVELTVEGNAVAAYAFDASGKALVDESLKVALAIEGKDDLALVWDAPSASYKATIDGKLDVDATPLVLRVEANGAVRTGRLASLNANAKLDAAAEARGAADLEANADVGAKAAAKVKAPAVTASVKAKQGAQAKAKVGTPKVQVKKSAGVTTKTGSSGAKAGAKAGFSFGTK